MEIAKYRGSLEKYGIIEPDNDRINGDARIDKDGDTEYVQFNMECLLCSYDYCRMFTRDGAVQITLDCGKIDRYSAQYCFNPFWTRPVYGTDVDEIDKEMQYILLESGDNYIFILPVSNNKFNTTIVSQDGKLTLWVNMLYSGAEHISGTAAVITTDTDPYMSIKKGFRTAYNKGLIKTPPRDCKKYPDVLNKLGWCSWDAFHHDISEEKLINKLEEFKAKGIPVKWVLIDDGWSQFKDDKLLSIYEDREKFPDGLKHTINRMKTEYGLEAVGVWHSLTGDWFGTAYEVDTVMESRKGRVIPKGYEFYSKWHSYLREQGVDFIKVDSQGNTVEFLKNTYNALGLISEIFDGLEKSAEENFDFMINCMGMNNINSLNHKSSVLLRSSDDFYPKKDDAFYNHAVDNIYNSVFYNELFYCDYDMWWSKHFAAKQNAVLRYMSGGPVYTSDEPDGSDNEYIRMFTADDGSFKRPKNALRPTYDCLFGFDKVLKAFNETDDGYFVTAFTFGDRGRTTVQSSDFGGHGNYEVTEFFSKEHFILSDGESKDIDLCSNDAKIYKFVKI